MPCCCCRRCCYCTLLPLLLSPLTHTSLLRYGAFFCDADLLPTPAPTFDAATVHYTVAIITSSMAAVLLVIVGVLCLLLRKKGAEKRMPMTEGTPLGVSSDPRFAPQGMELTAQRAMPAKPQGHKSVMF